MTIYAVCGEIGSGKSLYQLAFGLKMANQRQKRLVTNFGLNIPELLKYSQMMKYHWLTWLCQTGQIATVNLGADLNGESPLSYFLNPDLHSDSIALLDEAGIFLNAREFSKTPKSLLQDLAQSRKTGIDLIYCSQFDKQVDLQFRLLTQYFIHAGGLSKYDRHLKRPRLHWKNYYHFTAQQYWNWSENHKARSNPIRTRFMAFHTESGPLTASDKQLFKVFDSFTRLENQSASTRTFADRVPVSPSQLSQIRKSCHQQYQHFLRMERDYNYLLSQPLIEIRRYLKYRRLFPS